jgi:hypothetical protein
MTVGGETKVKVVAVLLCKTSGNMWCKIKIWHYRNRSVQGNHEKEQDMRREYCVSKTRKR